MTQLQKQAVIAAEQSADVSSLMMNGFRRVAQLMSHASANQLIEALDATAVQLDAFKAFMAGDKTGDEPEGTVPNPKLIPATKIDKRNQVDETGQPLVVDGVQQYVEVEVYNPKTNVDLVASHIFQPTTGLDVGSDGVLSGTDEDINTLSLRLKGGGALLNLSQTNVTLEGGEEITLLNLFERVTVVK